MILTVLLAAPGEARRQLGLTTVSVADAADVADSEVKGRSDCG